MTQTIHVSHTEHVLNLGLLILVSRGAALRQMIFPRRSSETRYWNLLIADERAGKYYAHSPVLGISGEFSGAANPRIPLHCPRSVSATMISHALSCTYMSTLRAALADCLSVSAPTLVHTMGASLGITDSPQVAARSA